MKLLDYVIFNGSTYFNSMGTVTADYGILKYVEATDTTKEMCLMGTPFSIPFGSWYSSNDKMWYFGSVNGALENYCHTKDATLKGELKWGVNSIYYNGVKLGSIKNNSGDITIAKNYSSPFKGNFGELIVYDSDLTTELYDFCPAIDDDGKVCFYDIVNKNFLYPVGTLGVGTGETTIKADVNKNKVYSNGGVLTITVFSTTDWTCSTPDFGELSATGGDALAKTAITLTIPPYSGTEDRSETITFTNGEDTATVTITQSYKEGLSGLQGVAKMYIGGSAVSKAYLGSTEVYTATTEG